MKKLLGTIIMATISISILAACNNSGTPEPSAPVDDTQFEQNTDNQQEQEIAVIDGDFATGLGILTYTDSSRGASDGSDGQVQVDSYPVTLTVDTYGRITNILIDRAQTRIAFNEQGVITTELNDEIFTKIELGPEVGMINASPIGVEWNDQTEFLMNWLIGKTLDEVKSLSVVENGKTTLNDVDLVSHVTIDLANNIGSMELALQNSTPFDTNDDNVRTGMGISTTIQNSTNAAEGTDGIARVESVVYGISVDSNDIILAVSIDNPQTEVTFNSNGELVGSNTIDVSSDSEQEIQAVLNWLIGKTIDEALSINTSEPDLLINENHLIALEKAINNLR